ncbi:MAG TPA: amylo-alpha-1,6-glucosidase [Vicinamibacteria bacterium]|nr:amylo-alpha-1,6-glucosidase [Vicinamibacteria bacterium]
MLRLGAEVVHDVALASRREWLLADGLGGWAASTVLGLNTRGGHGLLVTAATPAHPRLVLLSRVEEAVTCDGVRYELGTNDYGGALHPRGFEHADAFVLDPLPTLTWEVAGRRVSRTVARLHHEPAVVLVYQLEGAEPAALEVRPLLAYREPEKRQRENAAVRAEAARVGPDFVLQPYAGCPPLALRMAGATWESDPHWYRGFRYVMDVGDAGSPEDLFSPGLFRLVLRPGSTAAFTAWAGAIPPSTDPMVRVAGERRRIRALGDANEGFLPDLRRAADAFVVRAPSTGRAIVSGYPSGMKSAREALIALPGLCLATGRQDDARALLLNLTAQVEGPRVGPPASDESSNGEALDTGLWWVVTLERFREATGDHEFIRAKLQGPLLAILEGYRAGTRGGVGVSAEGLLGHEDGANPLGLTASGGGAETSRRGFAVEVQALWYSALIIGADLARAAGQTARAGDWTALAARARESFLRAFWSERHGYLADVVDGSRADFTLRPHQLHAIGLPHALLPRDKAQRVLEVVRRTLLTPVGVRSLAATDPAYEGTAGEQGLRAVALDRGAAWPCLAALYFDALIRVHGESAKAEAWRWLDEFAPRLADGTLASIPAAFEGDAPHRPLGEMASARAVAEVLRLVTRLGRRPSGRSVRPDQRS